MAETLETPGQAPQCPKCRLPLRPLQSAGVTLDACVECEGLWFGRGRVERIIGAQAAALFRGQLAGPGSTATKAGCPRGHGAMREVTVDLAGKKTDVSGCTQCGGVWISRGDLIQIRRYLRRRDAVADGRIGGLELQVDEAQREADDRVADEKQLTVETPKKAWLLQLGAGVPVEVYNPVRHRPFATYALIALNVLAFIAQMANDPRWGSDPAAAFSPVGLIDRFALVPAIFVHGLAPWTILTSMFMHGSVGHLLGNMYFLAVFGDNVEDRLGVPRYLGLYLLGGVAAALAHVASGPGSAVPVIGASGAISAVLGAYVYLFRRRRIYLFIFYALKRVPVPWYLGIWLALQVLGAATGAPGVAWWAHIGGFAVGAGLAFLHRELIRRRLAALETALATPS